MIILSAVFAQGFSDEELDFFIAEQKKNFELIKKCEITSFVPPDPDMQVTKIDIKGQTEGKCKIIIHTNKGVAEYLLPKEIYTKLTDIKDIYGGECSGSCSYVESVQAHEPEDEDEACMQECIVKDCSLSELECQKINKEKCEEECDMLGDAPDPADMSEEERCIFECVYEADPEVICGNSKEGETGNALCQRCADECVHLYAGPCLNDEEITEKEIACKTCEHCYGEPVMGDSGEGYECIVDIKCADASAEWGDDPGTGPDSFEPGHEPSEDNVYWWDYNSELEILDSEGTLSITNNEAEQEIEISIMADEGVLIEKRNEKLVIKNQDREFEVENNLGDIIISSNGNKRDIENIHIAIEDNKPVYNYDEKEKAKFLGFIPVNKNVQKKVNAENLDLIEEKEPWWAFLTTEEKEEVMRERKP